MYNGGVNNCRLMLADSTALLGLVDSRVEAGFSNLRSELIAMRMSIQTISVPETIEDSVLESTLVLDPEQIDTGIKHVQTLYSSAELLISSASEYYNSISGTVVMSVAGWDAETQARTKNWIPDPEGTDGDYSIAHGLSAKVTQMIQITTINMTKRKTRMIMTTMKTMRMMTAMTMTTTTTMRKKSLQKPEF